MFVNQDGPACRLPQARSDCDEEQMNRPCRESTPILVQNSNLQGTGSDEYKATPEKARR